jgi:NodT family efflux transporter outer membrane factor (OMF) lipoprotein
MHFVMNEDARPRKGLPLRISIGVVLIGTSGCAVGPNFKPPPVPSTSAYTRDPLPDATQAIDVPGGASQRFHIGRDLAGKWWTLFNDTELNRLIDEAIAKSPDIESQQAALRAARENVIAQRGSFAPRIQGTVNGDREEVSGASIGPSYSGFITNIFESTVNVSYTFDLFGGERRALESLEAQAEDQRFKLEASILTLTSNVASTVIQLASLNDQIGATNDIISSETHELELMKLQFAVGTISQADVAQQESTLALTRVALAPLEQQRSVAEYELAVLTGHASSEAIPLAATLQDFSLPVDLPVSLPSELVAHRPDVKAQEAQLRHANANIGVATANMLPQISITGAIGGESLVFSSLLQPESGVWNLAAGVTQPIFEGGALRAKRRAARDLYAQASADYRLVVLKAFENVADSLSAIAHDAQAFKAASAALDSAGVSLLLNQERFNAGSVSYVSLLTSEQAYARARVGYTQALANRYFDTVLLFQALGGGWWNRIDQRRTNLEPTSAGLDPTF